MMRKFTIILFAIIYDACISSAQGVWMQKADFGAGQRTEAVGFAIGTKGYIGTGEDAAAICYNDFWEYDLPSNAWTQKANFGGSVRKGAIGFSINSKGYIGTGRNGITFFQDFWEWDRTTNIWTQKANFSSIARIDAVAFSIGTMGYIGTGTGPGPSSNVLQDFWEWDQTTNTWSQKSSFTGTARYDAVGFSISTKGYIGTGYDNITGFRNDFWEWDQTTNTWAQKANFGGGPKSTATGFSVSSFGFIGLGRNAISGNYTNDFWKYDPSTNTWSQIVSFGGNVRARALSFTIGNYAFVGTGDTSIGGFGPMPLKDLWEFDPNGNGINETELENSISIYPNPSKGKTYIESSKYKITNMELYTFDGKKVYSISNLKPLTPNEIDLSSQPDGIYFLHISTEKGKVTKKIIHSH